ncbi:YIP1 family protein [Ferrimonas marina]|uniref:Yip1 domain-containing protein n=1 Tax=Ferrimonas marina TaxID=299255 RepID=A0A1M5XA60_9GAMM|nr:YIP1 family protein [Ferrimonas marina]SHH96103.1 Yip1 domain-containing protein [Ferrimonas marina]
MLFKRTPRAPAVPTPESIAAAFAQAELASRPFPHQAPLAVMLEPRQTLRGILDSSEPRRWFWWLLVLSLVVGQMDDVINLVSEGLMGPATLAKTLGVFLIAIPATYLIMKLAAWGYQHIGRWLGGKGDTESILVGMMWATVPQLLLLPVALLLALWVGLDAVFDLGWLAAEGWLFPLAVGLYVILQTVFAIWAFGLGIVNLATCHGFAIWRALLSFVLFILMVIVIALPLVLLLEWLFAL